MAQEVGNEGDSNHVPPLIYFSHRRRDETSDHSHLLIFIATDHVRLFARKLQHTILSTTKSRIQSKHRRKYKIKSFEMHRQINERHRKHRREQR